MTSATFAPPSARPQRKPVVPSGLVAMFMFISAEVMFFGGLFSAFTITRAGTLPILWPPPGQPRLPWQSTAFNTAALLVSGVLLVLAERRRGKSPSQAKGLLLATFALGTLFVVLQGVEWAALLGQGLTLTSSTLGSFFYLIVGTHALHAVIALIALAWAYVKLRRDTLTRTAFFTVEAFWLFVVLLWPFLYGRVYF